MENKHKFRPKPEHRLMDQVREVPRHHHYAYKTEQAYCSWILQYTRFYGGKTHPKFLDQNDVERFLSHLATKRRVASATPKQALNALVFLYKKVLDIDLGSGVAHLKSKRKISLPTVLTHEEVAKAPGQIKGDRLKPLGGGRVNHFFDIIHRQC